MTEPGQLGPVARVAAFFLAATGFATVVAAGQVAAMVIFPNALVGALPFVHVAFGVASLVVALKLAHPRAWARVAALFVLLALTCGGGPWALWLMWNGLFTALSVMAPAFALFTLVLVAVSWGDVGRVARVRAEAEAETARLMREAGVATASSGRGWMAVYALMAVPVGLFGVLIFAPETWAWAEVRVRGLAAGRNPFGSAWVERATAYPYGGSPLQWYLEYEAKWVPLPVESVMAVADGIADDVAWRLAAETGARDPVEAERALWAAGRQKELPLWIAAALRDRNAYYSVESLFSRSFDPEVHVVPDTVHLDCDQLVYVFLHVAWRLDLAMQAVPSPMHVYLRYGGPDGGEPLWVETTQFRHVDIRGDRVDFMGDGIGKEFFIDADHYPSGRGGTWAAASVVDAAGLYQPWTERDIRDSIVANVMVGVKRAGLDVPYVAELEAHAAGSRELTLVNNLYVAHLEAMRAALDAGDAAGAQAAAEDARAVRADAKGLIIYNDAEEEQVLAGL
ncbi:MAG: hypothetical protein ACOZNI_01485 [Myxococcota bacterium]